MTTFDVWAPDAERVELVLDDRRISMDRTARGWWSVAVDVTGSVDYGFALDGGGILPDPRSPWQPHGPHGRSRTFDTGAIDWHDAGWQPPPLESAVIYELHVGTFTPQGTFDAAIDHLAHLVDLGVTHVEVMPVADFPGERGWGYDGVGLYAVHRAYGGPAAFARFVDAAHGAGLAVILDVVYNHLGPDGNYLGRFGAYFNPGLQTPWGDGVNFDAADSDQVRAFVIDNALRWLRDFHVDGLRLDAIHAIRDVSATHVLAELGRRVRELESEIGRALFVTSEDNRNDPLVVTDPERNGWGHDAVWADDLHHALHVALTGERDGYYGDYGGLDDVATALTSPFLLDGRYSVHRRRIVGAPAGDLPPHRFVVSLQTHDQVGNRARGDRITDLVGLGRAMVGAALVLLSPYVPLIFQGEEWGASSPFQYFTDHEDPALADAVRRGRRNEFAAFGWQPDDVPDPQDPATFERSRLDWAERNEEPHRTMLGWYGELIALRKRLASAPAGPVSVRHDAAAGWLMLDRGSLRVVANLAEESRRIALSRPGSIVAASAAASLVDDAIELSPDSVAIVSG